MLMNLAAMVIIYHILRFLQTKFQYHVGDGIYSPENERNSILDIELYKKLTQKLLV